MQKTEISATRESKVSAAIKGIEISIGLIEKGIKCLEERLVVIIQPKQENPKAEEPPTISEIPMVQRLDADNYKLTYIYEDIESIINRLEI